ncbi:S8 family serine peptidase [Deinococcus detaillensis]|uniref:S8 family serine peptidase n=2 Tax=Deinococcus detaillensis TaxID=2592048 RepID=A0A553V233_9DEIO|nr:S8 family serine peptidase [Deinococcus detaillensis]
MPQPSAQAPKAAIAMTQTQTGTTAKGVIYYTHQLVVKYKGNSAQDAAQAVNGRIISTIPQLRTALIELPTKAGKQDSLLLAQQLVRQHLVSTAQPLIQMPSQNDPVEQGRHAMLAGQGFNANQIFDELPQYTLDENHMHAKAAWDAGITGKGVLIGTIDDPVDVTHPDLKANWAGKAYDPHTDTVYTDAQSWINAIDGFDGKVDGKVDTALEHGTAVTSDMVATRNGKGIVGVAPEAKFISAAIFEPQALSDFEFAKAITWSVDQGANVLNNSWGGTGYSSVIKEAMDYALSHNVTVVVSAGNSGRDEWQQPAQYPGIIVSAAGDGSNQKVNFSTYGQHISSLAPGLDILLAAPLWINSDGSRKTGVTPQTGSGYQLISGTSFSSPETAATAALILGRYPKATPYQVKRLMEETADGSVGSNPSGFDRETGWGLIRLDKLAIRLTSSQALPPAGANVNVQVRINTNPSNSEVPGVLSDVILEPQDTTINHQTYFAQTDDEGNARFYEIAPGTYTVRVGANDLSLTGDSTGQRGTAVTTMTFVSGTPVNNTQKVVLDKGLVNLNPVDPYEPNDDLATATPIAYGQKMQQAYIFGKPRDVDFYGFSGSAGDKITARVNGRSAIGGSLDSFMVLRDASGKKLAFNDDLESGIQDSQIDFTLPSDGKYYLEVSSYTILGENDGDSLTEGAEDDSPFNKYVLALDKN